MLNAKQVYIELYHVELLLCREGRGLNVAKRDWDQKIAALFEANHSAWEELSGARCGISLVMIVIKFGGIIYFVNRDLMC